MISCTYAKVFERERCSFSHVCAFKHMVLFCIAHLKTEWKLHGQYWSYSYTRSSCRSIDRPRTSKTLVNTEHLSAPGVVPVRLLVTIQIDRQLIGCAILKPCIFWNLKKKQKLYFESLISFVKRANEAHITFIWWSYMILYDNPAEGYYSITVFILVN